MAATEVIHFPTAVQHTPRLFPALIPSFSRVANFGTGIWATWHGVCGPVNNFAVAMPGVVWAAAMLTGFWVRR
jgi:hypothetical protein